jgi:hypothetical protein
VNCCGARICITFLVINEARIVGPVVVYGLHTILVYVVVNWPRCLQTREYESIGASVAICGRVGNMSLN